MPWFFTTPGDCRPSDGSRPATRPCFLRFSPGSINGRVSGSPKRPGSETRFSTRSTRDLTSKSVLGPYISAKGLATATFQPNDSRTLQEAAWMRDISRWAHGDKFDDVDRAAALFDWTVRNIQLEPDDGSPPRRPWQVLVYGAATLRSALGICRALPPARAERRHARHSAETRGRRQSGR